jgi:hypothetical protein
LFQYAWPHCGKIGRYVSHGARSLTGPMNVWFWEQVGKFSRLGRGKQNRWGGEKGTKRSSATVVRATGAVQVVVPSLWIVSPVGGWFDRMA